MEKWLNSYRWYETLPNPYDIDLKGWTRIHSETIHENMVKEFTLRTLYSRIWDKLQQNGKKEFLERNGISPGDTKAAYIRYNISRQFCFCVMAPIPDDIKPMYYLSYEPDKIAWR